MKRTKAKHEPKITLDIESELNKNVANVIKALGGRHLTDAYIEFFHAVRTFFAQFFALKYEFTLDELNKVVQKRRMVKALKKRIDVLLKSVAEMEFGQKKHTEPPLMEKLKEFEYIASKLLKKPPAKPSKPEEKSNGLSGGLKATFMDMIKALKLYESKEDKALRRKKKNVEKQKKEEEIKNLESIHQTLRKIKQLYAHIRTDLRGNHVYSAKADYVKLEKLYEQLDPKTRKQHYDMVKSVYREITEKKKIKDKEIEEVHDLMNLLKDTEKIIHKIDIAESKKKYKDALQRYQRLDSTKQEKVYKRIQKMWNIIKQREADEIIRNIDKTLQEAAQHLSNNDTKAASDAYLKGWSLYKTLPLEHQGRIYKKLKNFYDHTGRAKMQAGI